MDMIILAWVLKLYNCIGHFILLTKNFGMAVLCTKRKDKGKDIENKFIEGFLCHNLGFLLCV